MIELNRNLLLPYTPAQMYALVADIAQYPAFLPYCQQVAINAQNGSEVQASVVVGYKGLQYRFTTNNSNKPDEQITMQLINGPFETLNGVWHFKASGQACEVTLQLQAKFKNKLLNLVLKKKMNSFVDVFVDAFVKRARDLYD